MSENNHGKQSSPATAGPFDKTDSDLRIEALRQATDIWKHWDDIGHPDGDDTLIDRAKSFHDFLTGQTEGTPKAAWQAMLGRIQVIPEEEDSLTRLEYAVEVEGRGWVHGFDDRVEPSPPGTESRSSGVYHSIAAAQQAAETIRAHYGQLSVEDAVHIRCRTVTELRTDWA